MASLLPKAWEKRLVDVNVRKVRDADLAWADVVLVGAMLMQRERMLKILACCRVRGIRTVVGGPITSCMDDLALYADHVVVGEAEEIVPELAAGLDGGKAKPLYKRAERPGLDRTPLPDLDLINPKNYSSMAIQCSRGCPFNCEFCDIIEIYGRKPRTKSPAQVVAKVEHHAGELFPHVGFLVTNLTLPSRAVARVYNKRGTAEQWIKEGKQAVKMTRLSCHRFLSNEVQLWLSVIAYNLGNLWRRLALPRRIANGSLNSLQQLLVKTGGRLVKHPRYYWLLLAESHLTLRLFEAMVGRIESLPLPAG